MTYNLSFMDNATGLYSVVEGVNNASNGWLIGLILLASWALIIMVFMNKTDIEGLILGSSFIMGIVTGLFYFIGLIPSWILILPILGIITGIILKYTR